MKTKLTILANVLYELKMAWKDSDLRTVLYFVPLFYGLMYGMVYINKTESKVPIAILDNDKSVSSKLLIRKMTGHMLLAPTEVATFDEAQAKLLQANVHAIVFIDKDFEKNIKHRRGANVKLYLNNTKFLVSNDINRSVNDVILAFDSNVRTEYFQLIGLSGKKVETIIEPVAMEFHNLYNTSETYGNFILPGLLLLVLAQTLFICLSQSVGKEQNENSLRDRINTPAKLASFVAGKLLAYGGMFLLFGIAFFTLYFPLYSISFSGNITALFINYMVFLLVEILFILFVASWFRNKAIAIIVVACTSYPLFLASGYPWPFTALPSWVQFISALFPTTPILLILDSLVNVGTPTANYAKYINWSLALAAFYLILAIIRYTYIGKKQNSTDSMRKEPL